LWLTGGPEADKAAAMRAPTRQLSNEALRRWWGFLVTFGDKNVSAGGRCWPVGRKMGGAGKAVSACKINGGAGFCVYAGWAVRVVSIPIRLRQFALSWA